MQYELTKEKKKLIKTHIKQITEKISMWEEEYEKAKEARSKCAQKHYSNVIQRMNYAKEMADNYKKKIEEFNKILKDGYIEI